MWGQVGIVCVCLVGGQKLLSELLFTLFWLLLLFDKVLTENPSLMMYLTCLEFTDLTQLADQCAPAGLLSLPPQC